MQTFLSLIFGALIGAVLGWGLCAYFYFHIERSRYDIGFQWVNAHLPASFWPTSGRLALIGGLLGFAWVGAKVILYPHLRSWGILH
jgi:hypothetical protein